MAEDFQTVEVPDAQDLTGCISTLERHMTNEVSQWREENQDGKIVVDVTGGTKCMSAAIALVTRRWQCTFRYVGGERRTKEGLGVVEDSHERIFEYSKPLDALGFVAVEDALIFCSKANYSGAAEVLSSAAFRSESEPVQKSLKRFAQLCEALAAWDRFDFKCAQDSLQHLERRESELQAVLAQHCVSKILQSLQAWRIRLSALRQGSATQEILEELLANAERRVREGRFDDAVARFYRALEAMGQ
jgi:CRISPR-associated protein (TIGR02710 family)